MLVLGSLELTPWFLPMCYFGIFSAISYICNYISHPGNGVTVHIKTDMCVLHGLVITFQTLEHTPGNTTPLLTC